MKIYKEKQLIMEMYTILLHKPHKFQS